jgi:hypothetical protein
LIYNAINFQVRKSYLKRKNLFLFLDLLRVVAKVLTMCCFFDGRIFICCVR